LITNFNLTKEDLQALDTLEDYLKNEKKSMDDTKRVVSLYSNIHFLLNLEFLLKNLSEKDEFPVLDLCRLTLMNSDVLTYCLDEKEGISILIHS
jgi:hypothetical protein